ncbi:type II secretion system F family protein [Litoribrevibacter albus]|uniref:Type II secretion system protein F n=1 Tax=Litoribrevibacter albus TaxID=1473156 RepID=A0AA37WA81_9GAMM|nr:type II secretion system F family protein [Litoribrevibacter albus]GLQ33371.1 type II secretion system protein F [Litoribrevibacter albus]
MAKKQQEKKNYIWEGKDRSGKVAKGELTGLSVALVKTQLRSQGINPTKVTQEKAPLFGGKGKAIKPMDVAIFTRQLATMMKAGVPLVQSFDIVADGLQNANMRDLVLKIKTEVEGGSSFAYAIRQHPLYFDDLFCNLVESGEQSGALETMLDRIAQYKEKTEALKSKIKKAMNYPIAVVVIAFIVTAILLVKVVPQFEEVFAGFGAELPAFTQFVIHISEFMQEWWLLIFLGIAGLVFSLSQIVKRSTKAKNTLDKMMLKAPIIGSIIYQSAVARYCRTLSTTFAAGVPLVEALESVAGATGNVVFSKAVHGIKEDVSSGIQLNTSMKQTGLFPPMALQMVAIGEESGALDEMLDKVATHYETEVDNSVDGLTSLMEPIIMAVLGVLVGGLIVAMYLPIFQLGKAVM